MATNDYAAAEMPTLRLERVGDWLVRRNVPVFDEHVGSDGTHYTRDLLSRIAENCNQRAASTGDLCPLIVGHTSGEPGAEERPIVGYARDFRVNSHGRDQVPAIVADFYFHPDSEDIARKYVRRSVEIWNKNPEERFFDPIALLGGTTPRRDLGTYSRSASGQPVERYQMHDQYMGTAPGGFSTSVPQPIGHQPQGYAAPTAPSPVPSAGPIPPEQLAQIVQALQAIIQQEVARATRPVEHGQPTVDLPGAPMPSATKPAGPPMGQAPAPAPAQVPADHPSKPPQSPNREAYSREDDSFSELDDLPTVERYRREAHGWHDNYQRIRKERDAAREQYSRLQVAHEALAEEADTLRSENEALRASEKYSRRLQELTKVANQHDLVIDIDDEMSQWGGVEDGAWDMHLQAVSRYQRVPVQRQLPLHTTPENVQESEDEQKARRYSRQARERVAAARERGEDLDFGKALADVRSEAGN